MKKTLLSLLFIVVFGIIHAQEKDYFQRIDKVEKEIAEYIKEKFSTFKIPAEDLVQIKKNANLENQSLTEDELQKSLTAYKKYLLRVEFFEQYPAKRKLYAPSPSQAKIMQACTNGGFESGYGTPSDYTFTQANFPGVVTGGVNVVTTGSNFAPLAPSSSLNNSNSDASLVSPGTDPDVLEQRVMAGNRAIRLHNNITTPFGTEVTTMSRTFVVNQNFFNLNYSLILENPNNHPLSAQPFFVVRIYDQNNNIHRQVSAISNTQDCIFNSTNNGNTLFTGWVCDRINVSDLMGQTVRLEFIIVDCGYGAHWGKVYIDEICGTNCANPLNGGINLNPVPTIDCPIQNITVCGTYTLPDQSVYDNVSLNILQNGIIIGNIPSPTTHTPNMSGGIFCFIVPISFFGPNPNGNFEFQVQGNFTRICSGIGGDFPLDPIFDNSANDTRPDVSFINCITANNDVVTFNKCLSFGSFSILDNDLVYDNPATIGNTNISITSPVPSGISVNTSTGMVYVNLAIVGTGSYYFTYEICNANNPLHCDTANVTITITDPLITAIDNNFVFFPINGCDGGTTPSVLNNDFYCGQPINNFSKGFSISLLNNGGLSGASINLFGNAIIVPPSSTPGTYILIYEVCYLNICDTAQVTVVVSYGIIPEFSFLTEICKDISTPQLPTTSDNGINGTWSPSTINNQTSGTYTFTPDEACAETITVSVTVIDDCGLFLDWGGEVGCQNGNLEPINFDYEDIEDAPCLRVCENSSITYTITGNTATISSVSWNVSGGTITSISPDETVCEIQWGASASGFITVEVVLTDGSVLNMERCIEKLQPPSAYFEVVPYFEEGEIIVCAKTPAVFDNLSTKNGGHGDLYYTWDFGDDHYSNEFEPRHIYDEPGTYTVTLYATNGCSCGDEYTLEVVVTEPLPPIECPGVVCENGFSIYSMPDEVCPVVWDVIGGDIVWDDNLTVAVEWNNVDEEGFGYITATAEECGNCVITAKVPVVQAEGTIKGPLEICAGSQGQYSLPQWPTTDFNWSLQNNFIGASLRQTNQRNEIIVQTQISGTVTLVCNYFNTLLGCGGTAEFVIEVKPFLSLVGDEGLCLGNTGGFQFEDENGNLISNVDWLVSGPNNFTLSGSTSPFNITFPDAGTYVVEVISDIYCADLMKIEIGGSQNAPTAIVGPPTVCPGVPNTYSVTVPEGSVAHWAVTNGEILGASTGVEVSVNFFPGVLPFEVIVWFEKDDCQSQSFTLTAQPEMPDLNFTQGPASVCGSSYAIYKVADTTAETYYWEIIPSSAGSIQTGQNTNQVYVLWNQTALSNVEVKVTARKCQVYFDNSMFVDIIQSPQINVGGDVDACVNQFATFNVSLPPGAGFTDITWDFGDGTIAGPITNSTSITHEYKAPLTSSTNYTVTATVTGVNDCTMASVGSFIVTVSPSPVITVTPSFAAVCDPTINAFFAVNQQGGFAQTDQIQWYKDGVQVGVTTPIIDVTNSPGNYHAEVTNIFGCTNETAVVVAEGCPNGGNPVPDPCDGAPAHSFDSTPTITGCGEVTIIINNISGNYTNSYFTNIPTGATIIANNPPQQLVLGNLPPGSYHAAFVLEFPYSGEMCSYAERIEFTIPYSAGLKYNIACAGNGLYDVNLLDYSEYYPLTQPSLFEFSTDNGASWTTGTPNANGVPQLNTQLSPGTYQVGIRISGGGSPPCEAFETLVIPDLPNAAFTYIAGCQNEAVKFFAPPTTEQGLQYEWTFNGIVYYLIKDHVKNFENIGPHNVELMVTNKPGCSVSYTEDNVMLTSVNLTGDLLKSPATDCEGGTIALTFDPDPGQTMPSHFEWYKNETTLTPYAVTANPTLNVTENGQYFVFVKGPNGCWEYGNSPISVGFVQKPDPPVISGEPMVCQGSSIKLSIPESNDLTYTWYRNGAYQSQWYNDFEITDSRSPGTYQYEVYAKVTVDGVSCTSSAGSFTVNVVSPPATPQIQMDIKSCSPYQVKVYVANAQSGVTYYWSNGETGVNATMTHDGPIRVRAEVNNCSASAQTDLPTDLEALAWIFPKGCYGNCHSDFLQGYVIGPLDGFYHWEWQDTQGAIFQGSGMVLPLTNIPQGEDYSLFLDNGSCKLDIGEMYVDPGECGNCDIEINIGDVHCLNINGSWVYEIPVFFNNNQGNVWASFSVLNNQGYFTNNTVQLPPGGSAHVFYYYPQGFNGGNLDISITGTNIEGATCYDEISLNLPQCPPPPTPKPAPLENISMKVYPNPATEMATVFHQLSGEASWYTIAITDMNGKKLLSQQPKEVSGKLFFDCSGLQAGTYNVSLLKYGRTVTTIKLIVE